MATTLRTVGIYLLEDAVHTRGLAEHIDGLPALTGTVGVDLSEERSSAIGVDLEHAHREGAIGRDGRETAESLGDFVDGRWDHDGTGEQGGTAGIVLQVLQDGRVKLEGLLSGAATGDLTVESCGRTPSVDGARKPQRRNSTH